jgi:hypothetical protein
MKIAIILWSSCLLFCLCSSDSSANNSRPMYFAEKVIRFDPYYSGGISASPDGSNPFHALGAPDSRTVSLGSGGLIELGFVNSRLTNSGDTLREILIIEAGPEEEATFVAIRPTPETATLLGTAYDTNGDGFFELGRVVGGTSKIDIDSFFPGFPAGALVFDAIQLIDDPAQGSTTGGSVGADIDAVGILDFRCSFQPQGDLNGDCVVNLEDLAIIARNWLTNCTEDPNNPTCHPELDLEGTWLFTRGDDSQWELPGSNDSGWQEVVLPDTWENHSGYNKNNVFGWYRKKIKIPAAWAGLDLNLILGRIDDSDETFFNGEWVGSTGQMPPDFVTGWYLPRQYTIPANLIRFGEDNVIAVRVYDSTGPGGMFSGPLLIEIK